MCVRMCVLLHIPAQPGLVILNFDVIGLDPPYEATNGMCLCVYECMFQIGDVPCDLSERCGNIVLPSNPRC